MKRLAVVLALAFAASAFASIAPPTDCGERLPHALNVGVPRIASTTPDENRRLAGTLGTIFYDIYRESPGGDCGTAQPIQINIAIGNDYQLLAWLSQGLIDAAVVPDLSLVMLDKVGVYELPVDDQQDIDELMPAQQSAPVAKQRDARVKGSWRAVSEAPDAAYRRYLDQVWNAAEGRGAITMHLALASHLSTTGFALPIGDAARFFEEKLQRVTPEAGRVARRDAVWKQLMAHTSFTLDCGNVEDCFASLGNDETEDKHDLHRLPDGTVVVMFPGEEALLPAVNGTREHLAISTAAAQRIFGILEPNARFRKPAAHVPPSVLALINDPPSALRSAFEPQPLFGDRTYAFTVDESLQLLRQQQRLANNGNLALVLPGGGVKAVYQTKIIDELYRNHHLRNEWTSATTENGAALPVRTVIGTSGGALLGYFVSQLDARPVELYPILWTKDDGSTLKSTDVFGWTDILRYVSVVVSFALLCVILFFSAVQTPGQGTTVFRWRLTLATVPFFILAPVFIRLVSGNHIEHVPEIEGIFYMLMALCLIIADQCLVHGGTVVEKDPERERRRTLAIVALLIVAVPLITFPIFGSSRGTLTFSLAFTTMTLLVVGTTVALALANGKLLNPVRRAFEVIAAVALVLLLCAIGWILPLPHLLAGFALILLSGLQYWHARSPRRGLQWMISFAAIFFIAELCWPEDYARTSRFDFGFLQQRSLYDNTAAFFLSIGFLLLLVIGAFWTARNARYAMATRREIGVSLMVLVGYLFFTLSGVIGLTVIAPSFVTPLELTKEFWIALALVSGIVAAALFRAAKYFAPIRQALDFLREAHPNGTIVQRRYARMLLTAMAAVLWWNVVEAPALYGNGNARKYHDAAIVRFNKSRKSNTFSPTARFVTPANLLRQDGTRYFMFLAQNETDCPPVNNRPGSGAQWVAFRGDDKPAKAPCLARPADPALVREVAFASGSPFPIFPAHEVKGAPVFAAAMSGAADDDDANAYVDGGYSNNLPVDAARALDARQVLIVQSSNPLPAPEPKEGWFGQAKHTAKKSVLGKLIVNLNRLPSYLFERSQQVDRLSRHDMFVVSLSPDIDHTDWPPLFDFRASTVRRLHDDAESDLSKRIGMVESWGQPSFALHTDVRVGR
ncbi:MAG TPA: hypothetical protein VFN10_06255 [Thermoanaerobaculia bacterium]|nr:hypothetical protein [Thermoanaerobaculia bacterium]